MKVLNKILDIAKEGHDKIALKQYIVKLERKIVDLTSENEKLRIRVGLLENPEFEPYPDGLDIEQKRLNDLEDSDDTGV